VLINHGLLLASPEGNELVVQELISVQAVRLLILKVEPFFLDG